MTEPTPEQRAAWNDIKSLHPDSRIQRAFDVLFPLLPESLTNPQPTLPTEPGWYASGQEPMVAIFLDEADMKWWCGADEWNVPDAALHMPLTRLVPERPQVTKEQAQAVVNGDWRDGVELAKRIQALANGETK